MSCNCNCMGCGQPYSCCRCPRKKKPCGACPNCKPECGCQKKRAHIQECLDCDPCQPCKSMVKICSFTVAAMDDVAKYHNSFVYNQEDDSVYYVSDDGTPIRFGASPLFIDNFVPSSRSVPRQTVYDFANNIAYVFNAEGEYRTFTLTEAEE